MKKMEKENNKKNSNKIYLLSLSMHGIKNIEKKITISFYKKTVNKKKIIENNDFDNYKIKGIYGENGCGKTAIITAMDIIKNLIIRPNYLLEQENQDFLNEIINKNKKELFIEVEFFNIIGADILNIKYSVKLNKNKINNYEIKEEKLEYQYNCRKPLLIWHIKNGEIKTITTSDEKNREIIEGKTKNLLSTHSMSHTIVMNCYEIKEDLCYKLSTLIVRYFYKYIRVYLMKTDKEEHIKFNLDKKLDMFNSEEEKFFGKAVNGEIAKLLSKDFNSGETYYKKDTEYICNKKYYKDFEKYVKDLSEFIKIFKKDLKTIKIDKKEDKSECICSLVLEYGSYKVSEEYESTGIKKLINLFIAFRNACNGNIVFVDEIDANINDVYLCEILKYFIKFGKGQFIFTTHNIDIMNILKDKKQAIDFLTSNNEIVPWVQEGNKSPLNCYKMGAIKHLPFNIYDVDFLGILGGIDEET